MTLFSKKISLREASRLSGYHPDYLSYLIRSGKINGEKIGRNWMTTEGDIKKFLLGNSCKGYGKYIFAGVTLVLVLCASMLYGSFFIDNNASALTATVNQPREVVDEDFKIALDVVGKE